MKTSTEIRRENLNILIERYGSIANLNAQLGRNRKDATLSQIRKGSVHSGTGRPRMAYVDLMSVSRVWFKENISQIRENGYEIITAAGDSMEPTLKNGDLVVIDRFDTEITKRDGVFCVLIDNDLYLKRVQRVPGSLRFISDNRLYDPFEISLSEVESRVIVFGRMVNSLNLKRYD